MNAKKIALITGCSSSGIGYELVNLLSDLANYTVYATNSSIEMLQKLSLNNVIAKRLDVSNQSNINTVVEEILRDEEQIDLLVHCADIGHLSAVESLSIEDVKNVFNTNTIGLMSLTAKVLPSMKKRCIGRIIVLSSMYGVIGFPFNSVYSASKFAVEGYCESIYEELKHYCIKVSLVEPGHVTSEEVNKDNLNNAAQLNDETMKILETFIQKDNACRQTMGQTSTDIAQQIFQIILSPQPQLRYMTNTIYSKALSQVFKETDSR